MHELKIPRSFEFLGACSSGNTTRAPGDESFTTALIWALQALVEEQSKFLVSELSCKIREAPNFPKDQVPVQFDRGCRSIQRIMLAPLPESSDRGESISRDGGQGLLNLNLIFDEVPTASAIKQFGRALTHHVYTSEMPVNRIVWGGLTSWEGVQLSAGAHVRKLHAVKAFKEAGKRRRVSMMKHTSSQTIRPNSATSADDARLLSPSPTPSQTSQHTAKRRKNSHAKNLESAVESEEGKRKA